VIAAENRYATQCNTSNNYANNVVLRLSFVHIITVHVLHAVVSSVYVPRLLSVLDACLGV